MTDNTMDLNGATVEQAPQLILPRIGSNERALVDLNASITQALKTFDLVVKWGQMPIGGVATAGDRTIERKNMELAIVLDAMHPRYMGYNAMGDDFDPAKPYILPNAYFMGTPVNMASPVTCPLNVRFLRDRLEEALLVYRDGVHASPTFIQSINLSIVEHPDAKGESMIHLAIVQHRFVEDEVWDEYRTYEQVKGIVPTEEEGE